MTDTEELNLGAVSVLRAQDGGFPPNFVSSDVAGGSPWHDADDVTYATITSGVVDDTIVSDIAWAGTQILRSDATTCIDIVSTARVGILAGPDAEIAIEVNTPSSGATPVPGAPTGGDFVNLAAWVLPSSSVGAGPINLPTYSLYDAAIAAGVPSADALTALQGYAAAFAEGDAFFNGYQFPFVAAGAGLAVVDADLITRIYDVDVTFVYGTVTVSTVVRQYPRDDALGLGSATRIHPPPRAGRIVGGFA